MCFEFAEFCSRLVKVLVRREGFRSHVGRTASWREGEWERVIRGGAVLCFQLAIQGHRRECELNEVSMRKL